MKLIKTALACLALSLLVPMNMWVLRAAAVVEAAPQTGLVAPFPAELQATLQEGDSQDRKVVLPAPKAAAAPPGAPGIQEVSLGSNLRSGNSGGSGRWLFKPSSATVLSGANGSAEQTAYPSSYEWISAQSLPLQVLVYTDDSAGDGPKTPPDLALQELGWSYIAHYDGDFAGFEADLAGGKWDLVLFVSYKWLPASSTLALLEEHVKGGGRLIYQGTTGGMEADHSLWKALGLAWPDGAPGQPASALAFWEPTHPLFTIPETMPVTDMVAQPGSGLSGFPVEQLGGSLVLAGYGDLADLMRAGMLLANQGRTLSMTFHKALPYADLDGDSTLDAVELWINALAYVGAMDVSWLTASLDALQTDASQAQLEARSLTVKLDATGLEPGTYRALLKVAGAASEEPTVVPVILSVTSGEAPALDIGTADGEPGDTVTVPITLTNNGAQISATSNDIIYDYYTFESASALIGPAGSGAGKEISIESPSPGLLRVGVFGMNNYAIPDGEIAYLQLKIRSYASSGQQILENNPSASDPEGKTVAVTGANGTVTVKRKFKIVAAAGPHGSISPSGVVTVQEGGSQTFDITPEQGYQISDVLVNGYSIGAVASHTIEDVWEDHSITAVFQGDAFIITASADQGGIISPSGEVTVNQGSSQTFYIFPETGYKIADVLVDGSSIGPEASYTFWDVSANHTIHAVFAEAFHTIHAEAGENGSIDPPGDVQVREGADQTFSIVPDDGYEVSEVWVDGASVGAVTSYTFLNVRRSSSISAYFQRKTHIVMAIAGENGTIDPSGFIEVTDGQSVTFTIRPNTGYHVADVRVNGDSVGAQTEHTIENVTADQTIEAYFAVDMITITSSSTGSGTITPKGRVQVPYGGSRTFTMSPATGYYIKDVKVDGVSVGPVSFYVFEDVKKSHTISVRFEKLTFTIRSIASKGGKITPVGTLKVQYGTSKTFTITPNAGYKLLDVIVDGKSVGAKRKYTISKIRSDHWIVAAFGK